MLSLAIILIFPTPYIETRLKKTKHRDADVDYFYLKSNTFFLLYHAALKRTELIS